VFALLHFEVADENDGVGQGMLLTEYTWIQTYNYVEIIHFPPVTNIIDTSYPNSRGNFSETKRAQG
jgi:hypothetical protein